jgi:O-antigen/teichoic acid export membrane protein
MGNMDTGGQLRKTAKHSTIYAFGTMLSRITALVMLPIYTRYLSPTDYGVLELLIMAIEFAGILVGLRISQAMFRFYILAEDEQEKKVIVSTVLISIIASSSLGAAALYLAAEPLSLLIFGSIEYVYELQIFAFTLITNAVLAVGQTYIRARQMPILFVSIGAATLALQVTLNIIFVVMLEMHVTGVVYSSLLSGIIVSAGYTLYMIGGVGIHYSTAVALRLIAFLSPLILASIAAFYVAYADKYFLRAFGSLAAVGLYALAARISSILETLYHSFNMSWSADRFEIFKHENARAIYSQVFRFLSAALILIGAGLALFANDFFRVMTAPEFYPAGNIVPLLVAAGIARIYTMFCNFGIMLNERTRHIAEASWLKVIVASAGYILLIPYLGVYGAALTLLASNLIELFWVNRHATRAYDMGLMWSPAAGMLLAATVCVVAGMMLPAGDIAGLAGRTILYLLLVTAIYLMPVWHGNDREMMKAGVGKLRNLVASRRT